MIIGIDISQIVYEGTGVANYVNKIIFELLKNDLKNQYILFGSSFRKQHILKNYIKIVQKFNPNVTSKILPFPIVFFEYLWNKFHKIPIEYFVGNIDVFWSSDWVQPPLKKAIGVTTIHDLSILRYPESFPKKIIKVHSQKLYRSKKVCKLFLCDSIATKLDVISMLHIPESNLKVIYPGYSK